MHNSYQDLTPDTFLDSFTDFCKKVLWKFALLAIAVFFAYHQTKAYAKEVKISEEGSAVEFCFDITPIENGVLLEKKKVLGCFKKNEPPPKTKAYCRAKDWNYISIGSYVCINSEQNGYKMERRYPI